MEYGREELSCIKLHTGMMARTAGGRSPKFQLDLCFKISGLVIPQAGTRAQLSHITYNTRK